MCKENPRIHHISCYIHLLVLMLVTNTNNEMQIIPICFSVCMYGISYRWKTPPFKVADKISWNIVPLWIWKKMLWLTPQRAVATTRVLESSVWPPCQHAPAISSSYTEPYILPSLDCFQLETTSNTRLHFQENLSGNLQNKNDWLIVSSPGTSILTVALLQLPSCEWHKTLLMIS